MDNKNTQIFLKQATDFDKLVYESVLFGTIIENTANICKVKLENGDEIMAKLAVSCFIKPVENDKILLSRDTEHNFFVMSVLDRTADVAMELNLASRDVIMAVKSLGIIAQEDIAMMGSESIESFTKKGINTKEMIFTSDSLISSVSEVSWISKKVSTFVDTLISKSRVLFQSSKINNRVVDGIETINSNVRNDNIKNNLNLKAGNVIMSSKANFSMNAKQIFMN